MNVPARSQAVRLLLLVQLALLTRCFDLDSVHDKLWKNALRIEGKKNQVEGTSFQSARQLEVHKSLARGRQGKTICETGFNAGHSAATWLNTSAPGAQYYGFDAGKMFHKYPEPNAKLLNELVGDDRVHVTFGDSTKTLPKFAKENAGKDPRDRIICDLVHVDGGHFGKVPISDMKAMYALSNNDTLFVMDDVTCRKSYCKQPHVEWTKAIHEGWVKETECQRFGKFIGFCWGKFLHK